MRNPPRCKNPVGEGANRKRGGAGAGASSDVRVLYALLVLLLHPLLLLLLRRRLDGLGPALLAPRALCASSNDLERLAAMDGEWLMVNGSRKQRIKE